MGIIGDAFKAPFRAAKTLATMPLNIMGDTLSGAASGAGKFGKVAAFVAAIAAVPLVAGASLGVLPVLAGGAALTGAAIGAGAFLGGVGGALHGTGESLSNLAHLNGKTGIDRLDG